MRFTFVATLIVAHSAWVQEEIAQEMPVAVGEFQQEVSKAYTEDDGLPSNDVLSIAYSGGKVYAATREGLACFADGSWTVIESFVGKVVSGVYGFPESDSVIVLSEGALYSGSDLNKREWLPIELREQGVVRSIQNAGTGFKIGTSLGLYTNFTHDETLAEIAGGIPDIREMAVNAQGDGAEVIAADEGLFYRVHDAPWQALFPRDDVRSWAPRDVRATAFDGQGRLWFASTHGVGVLGESWTLYTGADGLPYNDFTCMATGVDDSIWFGTHLGAIHFDGKHWAYRQGKRWLPNDDIRDLTITPEGEAWFATAGGVGLIRPVPMTLDRKARFYEEEIDRYHRRTPYGYVLEVSLAEAGSKDNVRRHDSDNDGLWTSMYGAAQCFAYGATKDLEAKVRAENAFKALVFLREVTQGGSHPAPEGYIARTILPTSGPDPNAGRLERDRQERDEGDRLWKIIDPRWPVSEDGQWYWKSDTSSDELDGHYFFNALYYDLVAETEIEKEKVRAHVAAMTDLLVDNDFEYIDHDGKPTRWGHYSPKEMNADKNWFVERGLNSLSILSYLSVAEHVTGERRFHEAAQRLIHEHGYAQNLMYPKFQRGVGTGNQSDDEMAFMSYYNLIKYEKDTELKERYIQSFWHYWRLEQPELNPFFNFTFASQSIDVTFGDAWGRHNVSPTDEWLAESIDTLKRFPLDFVDWRLTNSHRLDIVPLPNWGRSFDQQNFSGRGMRVNNRVLPVDERHFNHWNTDPFRLDQGGSGRGLADGTVFLLPYYMGLYHGFIAN